MGKKILVPCLNVIMIAFFQFSVRNMVFHCIFLGKRAIIIYIKTRRKDLFSHYNLILRKLYEGWLEYSSECCLRLEQRVGDH